MNETIAADLIWGLLLIASIMVLGFAVLELIAQSDTLSERFRSRHDRRKALVSHTFLGVVPRSEWHTLDAWVNSRISTQRLPLYIRAGFTPEAAVTKSAKRLTMEELEVMSALRPTGTNPY